MLIFTGLMITQMAGLIKAKMKRNSILACPLMDCQALLLSVMALRDKRLVMRGGTEYKRKR